MSSGALLDIKMHEHRKHFCVLILAWNYTNGQVQGVRGSLLYYGRAMDNTILSMISEIVLSQVKSTTNTTGKLTCSEIISIHIKIQKYNFMHLP